MSFQTITAAMVLVTNVHGVESEDAIFVVRDPLGLQRRISSEFDIFDPFANRVRARVLPPLGRTTHLVIRTSRGRASAESRR